MSRHRFDELWRDVRWSYQPETSPTGMSSETFRWRLVYENVERFNQERKYHFSPSERICVDEFMSRWCGIGGYCIREGLPQYNAIDRKPENGCEIQTAGCGACRVMTSLILVRTAENERKHLEENEKGLPHGCVVLLRLVKSYFNSGRIVVSDSYFASVTAALEMKRNGLRFIGVFKTATKQFPLTYLNSFELTTRGQSRGVVSLDSDGNPEMMAVMWMDRNRRFFIATASSLAEGEPYSRRRLRQINQEPEAFPEMVDLSILQPQVCEIYYSACGKVDAHNRLMHRCRDSTPKGVCSK
eukprot:Plantae.Rhodophyta-Palmaria_palmata.ctg521.p1 GENE.Plantae.Rhodophyta-Palmaria_palmata.ctg521~~Plantae.Rhodophyta-Palmaria_palmata.ctg521.p1  ORF type:complete len:299 (+),score=20.18 Plantae.Rhodophyta-Palmaria_palmata.ctg521:501-1397(+)